jgi:hypothetical protein
VPEAAATIIFRRKMWLGRKDSKMPPRAQTLSLEWLNSIVRYELVRRLLQNSFQAQLRDGQDFQPFHKCQRINVASRRWGSLWA